MKRELTIIVFIAFSVFYCKNKSENKSIEPTINIEKQEKINHNEHEHWTYDGETGPKHWAEIEKQSDCNGKRQSPINIIDKDVIVDDSLKPLDIHYSTDVKIHGITNNGHSIQYDFEKGDFIVLNDNKYELKQIHFHEASEHTINGIRYPLEIHLVHINKDKIVVLAILAKEGESSEPFTFLEKYLPIYSGETKLLDAEFDLNLKLPTDKGYYTYNGSLTTPPCTQNVTWFVCKAPITVSVSQVKQLQELMPLNNYRDEQPINERVVKQYVGH